jgi:hypothetical protein
MLNAVYPAVLHLSLCPSETCSGFYLSLMISCQWLLDSEEGMMGVRSEIVHLQMAVSISSTVFCITSCALFCLIECCDSSSRMVHCFRCQSLVDGFLLTADWLKQFCFDLLIRLLCSLIFYPPLVSVLTAPCACVFNATGVCARLWGLDSPDFWSCIFLPLCVITWLCHVQWW